MASRAALFAAAWFQADWNWSSSAVETGYLIACNKVATSNPFLIPSMGLSAVQGGTRARPWYVHGMLGEARYVGFIPVRDTSEARRFYEGTLGLQVLEDTPFALVVEAKATMLRVTPVPELVPSLTGASSAPSTTAWCRTNWESGPHREAIGWPGSEIRTATPSR